MTTRKNASPKSVKKPAAKPSAATPAKKGTPPTAKSKSSASQNGAAKVSTPAPVPVVVAESVSPVQPVHRTPAPPWRVFSHNVGPNLIGGDVDFVVGLGSDGFDAPPRFVSVSAEGISPEFGDAFAFRILERTADFVRIRVRRLDENGGSWGDNLVVQILCVV
jgi:hypothetical protein